jgi:Ca2+-binding RTX toxin-like protein
VTTDPADPATSWDINDVAGVVSRLGVPVWHATGFTDLRLGHFALAADIAVQGTGADEEFDLFDRPAGGHVTIDGAGGDDEFTVREYHEGTLIGHGGRDEVKLIGTFGGTLRARGKADFQLNRNRGVVKARGTTRHWAVSGIEILKVFGFGAITATGTRHSDRILAADACRVTVRGSGGDDVLTRRRASDCGKHGQSTLVDGGSGNDVLIGSQGNDVLLGGGGRDSADGRSGVDRCVAEKKKGCEK